jgi:hypothetical protein
MNKKNEPNRGSLGSGFGQDIPDDVSDFFGSEAPQAEPSVQWTAERELAAREALALEAEAKAEAERAAIAAQLQTVEPQTLVAPTRVAARASSSSRTAKAESRGETSNQGLVETPPKEPKTFGQTIRSHWDSLIDSLGIGGKSKVDRARGPLESNDEMGEATQPRGGAATAADSEAEPGPASRTRTASPKPPAARSTRERPSSGPERPSSKSPTAAAGAGTTPAMAAGPAKAAERPTAEIPADAFGFGIFDPPSAALPNPLDSLFQQSVTDGEALEEIDTPVRSPERRPSGPRQRNTRQPTQTDAEFESREPRRQRSRPAKPEPEPVADDLAEDEIEFEVVDLAGDDISDLWDRPRRTSREEIPDLPPVEDVTPRHRGRPRPEQSQPAPPANIRVPAPVARVPAVRAPVPRTPVDEPLDEDQPEPSSLRRRSRTSRTRQPEPDRPTQPVARDAAGARRRPPASDRPDPARVPRQRERDGNDDDDDGYTVDNSWSPEDAPDPDAPRRRPVPAWRMVIDHIVDLNLSNRRGAEGGRRRSGSSPRGTSSSSTAGRRPDVPADRSAGRRANPPTYLDDPNPVGDYVGYDDAEWESPAPEAKPPRANGNRGRRPPRPDDFPPPDDRPAGRGRRRY